MKNLITLLSIITMMTACSNSKKEKADLVIINGRVLTIDKENPMAEAIAIKGEKIIAVGTTRNISGMIAKGTTEVVDASGRLVIPGFNDAHLHFGWTQEYHPARAFRLIDFEGDRPEYHQEQPSHLPRSNTYGTDCQQ